MKRVYVNEKWCLGCHLCEYYCAYANVNNANTSKVKDMARALRSDEMFKDIKINPRIKIEQKDNVCFAVSCRHCHEPLCVKSCITGAISVIGGVITIDQNKCVSCYTCILSCPYGAVSVSENGAAQKCELCVKNSGKNIDAGIPACVKGCPNGAIVFEERG